MKNNREIFSPSATTVWDFSNISNTTFATASGSTCLSFLLGGFDIQQHLATSSNRFFKSLTILNISVALSVPTYRVMSCCCVVCHVTCKNVNETFPLHFFLNCLKYHLIWAQKMICCYTCVFSEIAMFQSGVFSLCRFNLHNYKVYGNTPMPPANSLNDPSLNPYTLFSHIGFHAWFVSQVNWTW